MELDTGAALSVISRADYEKSYLLHVPLEKTDVKLESYTKEVILPIGVLNVSVKYQNQCDAVQLYVVNNGGPPLFGRQWLQVIKLHWPQIKRIDCSGVNSHVNDVGLLERHKTVFATDCHKTSL